MLRMLQKMKSKKQTAEKKSENVDNLVKKMLKYAWEAGQLYLTVITTLYGDARSVSVACSKENWWSYSKWQNIGQVKKGYFNAELTGNVIMSTKDLLKYVNKIVSSIHTL